MNISFFRAIGIFLSILAIPSLAYAQICPASNAVGVAGIGDGCTTKGAEGWLPSIAIFEGLFTPACNAHDKCYSTLGTSYDECDTRFRWAMEDACKSEFPAWLLPGEYLACFRTSQEFYNAVRIYHGVFDTLPSIHAEALYRSRVMQANVENDVCGTTPDRTTLYSQGLMEHISNTFVAYAGRGPTPYEFFDAVNASDIVYRRDEWEATLLSKAQQAAYVTPPSVGYSVFAPGSWSGPTASVVTFTAAPIESGATYRWKLNRSTYDNVRARVPFFKNSNTLAVSGYMKATSATGARNLTIIQRTFRFQNVCGPQQIISCY